MGVFQFPELEASQGLVKNSQVQGEEWMAHLRPVMMNMTLREIQFPGAYHCLSKLQNWSITDQLRLGIRAFESAVTYDPSKKDNTRFMVQNDKHGNPLEAFCNDIIKFVSEHVLEIVLIDFTSFNAADGGSFNFTEFAKTIDAFLGPRLIPPKHKLTLSEIWGSYDYERVILTLDFDSFVHPSVWPRIHHIRPPEKLKDKNRLELYMDMIYHKQTLRFPYRNLYSVEFPVGGIPLKEWSKRINEHFSPQHFTAGFQNIIMTE